MKHLSASAAVENISGEGNKAWNSNGSGFVRRIMQTIMVFVGFAVLWMFVYNNSASRFGSSRFGFPATISHYFNGFSSQEYYDPNLKNILKNASMKDKTVILTTLNDAWAEPGSIFDQFLESFQVGGNQTQKLLDHLVVITWDQKAYSRCVDLHKYCYQLQTNGDNFTSEAFFMTPSYLHMMWRRIEFLGTVLQLGYSFVFTDTDIMWLRDPFPLFYKEADFQIACDFFNGNSYDLHNYPNGGFTYVRSNPRTIWFYRFWYKSRESYPTKHDQDVLNKIKMHPLITTKKLKIRFLSTGYFGGFCQSSKDFNKVTTMHANCCVGLENKVEDLKIVLEVWKKYMKLDEIVRKNSHPSWNVPKSCRGSFERAREKRKKNKGRL